MVYSDRLLQTSLHLWLDCATAYEISNATQSGPEWLAAWDFPEWHWYVYRCFPGNALMSALAIWGYDSILQTPDELRGDASLGSDLPEWITNNATFTPSAGLRWQAIPEDLQESWNGFALRMSLYSFFHGADQRCSGR